ELVEIEVADFRVVEDVVAILVVADFFAKGLDFFGKVFVRARHGQGIIFVGRGVRLCAARARETQSRPRGRPRLASKVQTRKWGTVGQSFRWRLFMKTIIETPRLVLREFVPADADALARVTSDPVTMRYFPMRF